MVRTPPVLLVAAVLATLVPPVGAVKAQSDARERTLYVSVVNDAGEPVEGLGPDAFVVREDGTRREVLRVSRATEPIQIALLVDNSAAAAEHITNLRAGLTAFVDAMHKENDIALIGLADRPTILVDYTRNRELLTRGIGRVFGMAGSGMTLLDAIMETSRGLDKRDGPRAVILAVLTDGVEFTNEYDRTVIDALRKSGAAFHAVTIGTFPPGPDDVRRYRAIVLDEGPRVTGGRRETVLASTAVEQALTKIARELSSQYKVVYSRPSSLIPPEKIQVSVTRPDLTARGTPERRKAGA
jgi:VWFA-related protein